MPRKPRRIENGVVYHLISRFVDRDWFITSESERRQYIDLLGNALNKTDWRCLAFAVMSNHVHLAVVAGSQELAAWIRRVHAPFADWMNRSHDRIGSMFVRGPKSLPVAPGGVGQVIAYIHNNPVRGGVVELPSASKWTSHRYYVGVDRAPAWLHVEEGLSRSGFTSPAEFDRWVSDPAREGFDAAWSGLTEEVVANEPAVCVAMQPPTRPGLPALLRSVADQLDLELTNLRSRQRGRSEVFGREVVVRCGYLVGFNCTEIASALCLSQQGVSAIRRRPPSSRVVEVAARVLNQLEANGATEALLGQVVQVVQVVPDP